MSTILSDIADISMSVDTWIFHLDSYNVGIVLGKIFKIGYQLWMEGWFE